MDSESPDYSMHSVKYFTTTILRKIRKMDYAHVPLIPGYERSEKEYVSTRNNMNNTNKVIKELMTYEHGNRFIKLIKEGLQKLNDKASLDLFKSRHVYESISLIARKMSMLNLDPEDAETAAKFSTSYKGIAEAKNNLNVRLEEVRLKLKDKRKQSFDIDNMRKRLLNMRYDLEVMYTDETYDDSLREVGKKGFQEFSGKVLKSMISFVEDNGLAVTLKEIAEEYRKYMTESSDLLKNVE